SAFNPATGNTFTIIDNDLADAVGGTFSGLAGGATFTATTGGTSSYKITYVGGDGNDVVLTAINDAPTLTETGSNPSFIENGSAVDLFSTVTVSAKEAADNLDQLVVTVTNVAGTGAAESLFIDGTTVALTHGNSQTTATNT